MNCPFLRQLRVLLKLWRPRKTRRIWERRHSPSSMDSTVENDHGKFCPLRFAYLDDGEGKVLAQGRFRGLAVSFTIGFRSGFLVVYDVCQKRLGYLRKPVMLPQFASSFVDYFPRWLPCRGSCYDVLLQIECSWQILTWRTNSAACWSLWCNFEIVSCTITHRPWCIRVYSVFRSV